MATITPIKPSAAELNTAIGRTDPVNTQSLCGRFVYYTTVDPRLPELAQKVNKHALMVLAAIFTFFTAGLGYFLVKHCLTLYKDLKATEASIQEDYATLSKDVADGKAVVARVLKTAQLGMTASALRVADSLTDTVVAAPANTIFGTLRGDAKNLARLLVASSLLPEKAFGQADAIIAATAVSDNNHLVMAASLVRQGKATDAIAELDKIKDEETKIWSGVSILQFHQAYIGHFIAQTIPFASKQAAIVLRILQDVPANIAVNPSLYAMPKMITLFIEKAGVLDLRSALLFIIASTFLSNKQYKLAADYFEQIPNPDFKQFCMTELHCLQGNKERAVAALQAISNPVLRADIIVSYFAAREYSHGAVLSFLEELTKAGDHEKALTLSGSLPSIDSKEPYLAVTVDEDTIWNRLRGSRIIELKLPDIARAKVIATIISMPTRNLELAATCCSTFSDAIISAAYLRSINRTKNTASVAPSTRAA